MGRKKKQYGECAYCGRKDLLTRDEVIPRCLFSKPLPSNLIRVLACAKCNNEEKSIDDEFLRDLLLSDVNSMKNETASSLFDNKVLSSIKKNKSAFARQTAQTAKLIPAYSEGGIYLGDVYQIRVEGERVHRIFSRIATGLYYWKTQQRVPPNCDYSVEQISPKQFEEDKKLFMETGYYGHKCRKEFTLIMSCNPNKDNFVALFWLIFYEQTRWFIGISPSQT